MSRHITAGVDGTPESRAAAAWAADEAALRGLPLRLVYAEDWPPVTRCGVTTHPTGDYETQQRWSELMLTETAHDVRERHPDLAVTTQAVTGRPRAALAAEASERADAELLALGSRGFGRIAGFLIGSVGLATISHAERPVVLVRAERTHDGESHWNRDVVVGVDVDRPADALLDFAFDTAAHHDRTLRVVHSWPRSPALDEEAAPADDARTVTGEIESALAELVVPWRHRHPSVRVVPQVMVGSPGEQLAHCAAEAGLVVVGRRVQHSPLGTHIDPVIHAVVHHSPAPVAVVAHA